MYYLAKHWFIAHRNYRNQHPDLKSCIHYLKNENNKPYLTYNLQNSGCKRCGSNRTMWSKLFRFTCCATTVTAHSQHSLLQLTPASQAKLCWSFIRTVILNLTQRPDCSNKLLDLTGEWEEPGWKQHIASLRFQLRSVNAMGICSTALETGITLEKCFHCSSAKREVKQESGEPPVRQCSISKLISRYMPYSHPLAGNLDEHRLWLCASTMQGGWC